jgi:hypothetical protein
MLIGLCLIVIGLAFSATALPARAIETGLEYGTATGLGTQDLRVTVMQIIRVALGFLGILAIAIILYAGFVWMTSGGNEEKIETAKRTLRNAAIGLLLIFFSFAIVSFVINTLLGGTGAPPGGGPPGGCDGCDNLGTGVIQAVYPIPGQRDVARNTDVLVTFKVAMDPNSVVVGGCPTLPCSGQLDTDSVQIEEQNEEQSQELTSDQVTVSTTDGKNFRFNPTPLLGDSDNKSWYLVTLTDQIEKSNGETAFSGLSKDYFGWTFEVGALVDIDPPEIGTRDSSGGVFPPPDNSSDAYSQEAAELASGTVTVTALPRVAVNAAVGAATAVPVSAPTLSISGSYNCAVDAQVCVSTSDGTNFQVTAKDPGQACSAPASIAVPGLNPTGTLSGSGLSAGCGLQLGFASAPQAGNQWSFGVTAQRVADSLQIDRQTISFVAGTPTDNQVQVASGDTTATIATKIAASVSGAATTPVTASANGAAVTLTAKTAGRTGNSVVVAASTSGGRSWATVAAMSGGDDARFIPSRQGAPDQPRNALFQIMFNEPIAADSLPSETSATTAIRVERQEGDGTWTNVPAVIQIANAFQTIELFPKEECKDDAGNSLENSCGDKLFCWPITPLDPYAATHYRVTVVAAMLKDCAGVSCDDVSYSLCVPTAGGQGSVCTSDLNADGVANDAGAYAYPEARLGGTGIADTANNSLNGNRDTYELAGRTYGRSQGPQSQSNQSPFDLNAPQAATQGDDVTWSFYINRNVDLLAPQISAVGPTILGTATSLTRPVTSMFTKVMSQATLKPGSNYPDGSCGCTSATPAGQPATQGTCAENQVCELKAGQTVGRCTLAGGGDYLCLENTDCEPYNDPILNETGPVCKNRKYVTLIDQATQKVGWWVQSSNFDVNADTYADITQGELWHSRFLPVTNYSMEVGSGVKDIYQNCYLPGHGPNVSTPSLCSGNGNSCRTDVECPAGQRCQMRGAGYCNGNPAEPCQANGECAVGEACVLAQVNDCYNPADPSKAFCCNGVALTEAGWKGSTCYTGY